MQLINLSKIYFIIIIYQPYYTVNNVPVHPSESEWVIHRGDYAVIFIQVELALAPQHLIKIVPTLGGLVSPFAHFDLARSDDVKLKHNSQSSVSSLIPSLGRTCLEMWTRVGHATVRCMGNTHTPAEVGPARLTAAISLTCLILTVCLFILSPCLVLYM